jgi:HSP20 family protein
MRGLVHWEPFNDLISLRDAMDRLFRESFIRPYESGLVTWGTNKLPIDMYETETAVVIRAIVPGVRPEDIDITVSGDTLTIKGEIMPPEEAELYDYYCRECPCGAFSRAITLPGNLDTDSANASFENE